MAQLVYIDETGSPGKGAKGQPLLTLAAVVVDEDKVRPLAEAVRQIAWKHLQWVPATFELHGVEIWNGQGDWKGLPPAKLIEIYEDAIAVLKDLALESSHASIHKERLRQRYGGSADDRAYLLALQFLLEKIDAGGQTYKIVVADEAKEHELTASRWSQTCRIGQVEEKSPAANYRPLSTRCTSLDRTQAQASRWPT